MTSYRRALVGDAAHPSGPGAVRVRLIFNITVQADRRCTEGCTAARACSWLDTSSVTLPPAVREDSEANRCSVCRSAAHVSPLPRPSAGRKHAHSALCARAYPVAPMADREEDDMKNKKNTERLVRLEAALAVGREARGHLVMRGRRWFASRSLPAIPGTERER